jgi:hypothetical protein
MDVARLEAMSPSFIARYAEAKGRRPEVAAAGDRS